MRGLDPIFQVLRTISPLAWLPISLGIGMLVRPCRPQPQRLLGMLGPDLTGGAGGEADGLIDGLFGPRLAGAGRLPVANLPFGPRLWGRNDDGGDVLVGMDAAGGQPVAQPQVMRAAGEGHGDLHLPASSWRRRP